MEYNYGQNEFFVNFACLSKVFISCRYKANHTVYNTFHNIRKSFSHVI